MNKKLLMFALIPLVLSVMGTPAMAIGPHKAEKNPHRSEPAPGEVEFLLPSGVGNGWINDTDLGVTDSWHFKNASKFKIRNAPALDFNDLLDLFLFGNLTYENKWCLIELEVLFALIDYMVDMGAMPPEMGEQMKAEFEAMFPEGMYFMFVNVGN